MRTEGEWSPSKSPVDRSAIKSILNVSATPKAKPGGDPNYVCDNLIASLQFNKEGHSSDQKFTKKTPATSPCHNCGKLGHWAPDCPLPRKNVTFGSDKPTGNHNPNHSKTQGGGILCGSLHLTFAFKVSTQ
eukprot:scaffold2192_cov268-Chaetoceros_neogracile.AAC.78